MPKKQKTTKQKRPGYGNAYLLGGCLYGSMMSTIVWGCWETHSRCQSEVQMSDPLIRQIRLSEPGSIGGSLMKTWWKCYIAFPFCQNISILSYVLLLCSITHGLFHFPCLNEIVDRLYIGIIFLSEERRNWIKKG